jgi:ribosomal protein L37AE/L43A
VEYYLKMNPRTQVVCSVCGDEFLTRNPRSVFRCISCRSMRKGDPTPEEIEEECARLRARKRPVGQPPVTVPFVNFSLRRRGKTAT